MTYDEQRLYAAFQCELPAEDLPRATHALLTGDSEVLAVLIEREQVIVDQPVTATIDAGAGLGQPVAYRAMQSAIQKALQFGAGFVAVRNSNHYGIAGYPAHVR